jgi:hypothetical protein
MARGRTKEADIVFVLDATSSSDSVFLAVAEQVHDTGFDFHRVFRDVNDCYGVVAYRDPVDLPSDTHEMLQLTSVLEEVGVWLGKVECYGGRDDPEDWVGALDMALHQINWRNGKKCIFWIADANAHGSRFSGLAADPHEDQGPLLEALVREMAAKRFYFVGMNIKKGKDPGCARTFSAMRDIYNEAGGISFKCDEEFNCTWDREKYDGDDWPRYLLDQFKQTVADTVARGIMPLLEDLAK